MILYLKMGSIKLRRMFSRRLYVLSAMDIGCVAGRCTGLANFLPIII